ncbi:hypothetical protein [Absidia glauca]|uniref:protein kinase C n=1 Tax=Absidia glauca TaxID=4829 RepID=A0A168MQQ2_ABSGL|nr:hypothetical protein [Absidia glauca]
MVPEENTQTSSDTQTHTSLSSWQEDVWESDTIDQQLQTKKTATSYSTPLRHTGSSSPSDTEQRLQFLRDMEKARKQLALFRQEMNGLATQIHGITDDLHESKTRVHEIEQDLTETQEDNVNLQVLLEKAVKSQKESDVFATQAIRNIHSDLNLVVRENNQLQERLASIEYIQREHKGNVHDMISRMQEYVFMLEQAQDTIQLMQEPPIRHHHPTSLGVEHISMSLQDLGLESRRTSESSSYITEDEEMGISIRKESQLVNRQHLTVPSSYITSHPRIVHKRASFPAFLPSPILAPQKDLSDQAAKIQELLSRIEQNERVRDTAKHMRPLLTDRNALSQCDTEIKKAQMYIDYFTDEVHKLMNRSSGKSSAMAEGALHASQSDASLDPSSASTTEVGIPSTKKRYSTLDLLTTDTPYNKPKVSLKLHELEYKLDVEKKVLDGTKTLADALDRQQSAAQSDRKQRDEIKNQMYESIEKLGLLSRALRKYKGLYIGEGEEEEEDYGNLEAERRDAFSYPVVFMIELETPPSARLPPGFRRPVTGKLQLEILEARELAHAPTRMIRSPETTVYIKIDGNIVTKSKPSRTDRWMDLCEIHVNKASEVEVAIYDHDAERSLPIGMFWLRITDIAEGLRKRKIQQDSGQGWAPADDAMRQRQLDSSGEQQQQNQQQNATLSTAEDGNGIQAWFDVEPVGEISLRLNFVRESANRRPLDKLGRAGAVRQRPEAIHEMNGHQFAEKKFYNVMKCALCGDFLVNSGYQCEDCVYTCHKKCYTKVVTKCISKSEKDVDEDKLNHKIPHRFEPITNIGANWCCHCGYMLSLGSRSAKKCSECGITCHIKCAHLVPDFCGLSMEMANQMLAEIKAAKRKTGDGSTKATATLANQLSQMQIHGGDSPSPSPSTSATTKPYAPIPNTASSSGQSPPLPPKDTVAPPPPATTTAASVTRRVTLDDFSFLAVLGKGNFGKVMLAEDRHDQNIYAVKVLKKRFIIDNDEIESLRSEKRIFQAANRERHPFLIGLHSCFQTESRVYFVMEYVRGGDLMWHIQREPFSERRAKFYACEVLLALEYFHSLGIIYRDLKLDNIMLGLDGHIKVADYGLCKEGMFYGNNTGTFCGTPEFMSPEILLEQRYGRASPFRGEDEDEIFDAILEDDILYPINMSRDSVSICQRLLTRDPAHRLGAGPDDAADIRAHPFFRGVNWDDMLAKRVPPPFYPTVNGRLDTSNFDEQFTAERPALTPIPGGMNRAEQQEFVQFSYVAGDA